MERKHMSGRDIYYLDNSGGESKSTEKEPIQENLIKMPGLYKELKGNIEDLYRQIGFGIHAPTFMRALKKTKPLFDEFYREMEKFGKEAMKKREM